jgi:CHASE2 domain-containing sensor protein
MIELFKAWFGFAGAVFAELLNQKEFGAVAVGTLAAIAITQAVKMAVIHSNLPNGPWRVWYLTTLTIGIFITYLNWPTALGFSWGIVAGGLFAPILYLCATRLLYLKWPELRDRISATPRGT